jgi:hypothetical protein
LEQAMVLLIFHVKYLPLFFLAFVLFSVPSAFLEKAKYIFPGERQDLGRLSF